MKITSVDIIDVANDLQSSTSKWRPVVVKINTDEGICGYGEVGMAYGVGASAGFGMAKRSAPTGAWAKGTPFQKYVPDRALSSAP